jgi:hypothetical protein
MEGTGSVEQRHFKKLVDSRAWWKISPDQDHSVVINSGGVYPATITAMHADDGETVIVYLPGGTLGPRVALNKVSGGGAKCWWFNPRTGDAVIIGTYPTTLGNRTYTLPDTNDWVLVLDDATKNLAAPGAAAYAGAVRQTESPDGARLPVSRLLDSRHAADTSAATASVPGAETGAPLGALEFELHTVDPAGPANPWTKIAGDLDGDGRDELIVGGQKGPLVWYHWPDFKKHTIADSGWNTVSGALGDVDGDGNLDVLMGGSVWFETIREGGQVRWQAHVFAEFHRNATVAVADFNGDGRPDVALAPSELAGQHYRLSWFEAPEDPRVGSWPEHRLADPIEAVVHSLAATDFDRDGRHMVDQNE